MITLEQLYGRFINHPDATPERKANSRVLLDCVAKLEAYAVADGIKFHENPCTECGISGEIYGGFRPQDCPQGAPHSSHKEGFAVDRYDPTGEIDAWCIINLDKLKECGIYIESPDFTKNWSHWSAKPPASGHTVFIP